MAKENKVAIYSTSNGVMLGTKEGKTITGIMIDRADHVSEEDFAAYQMAIMKGNLQQTVIGKNDTFGKREIVGKEAISQKVVELQMSEAQNLGDNWVTEQVFGELRGK